MSVSVAARGGDRRSVPASMTVFLVALFLIPARFLVPGLGAAGAPAALIGLAMLGLVLLATITPGSKRIPWGPIPVALLFYVAVLLSSYVSGRTRAISRLSGSQSDRTVIALLSLVGIALFVASHIRSTRAVFRLIDVVLFCSMLMCGVGLVQFFLGIDVTTYVRIPGLVSFQVDNLTQRSIFNRPLGTALHPIEYGVVTAGLVPVAIARALRSGGARWWAIVCVLAFCALTSISRSAILVLAVMFLVFLVGVGWRRRGNMVIGAVVFVIVAGSAVPGLIGTLRSLSTNTDNDPSVQARIDRFPRVLDLVREYPWFGRGYGTYNIQDYFLLDNEIQKLAIEIGLFGLLSFAGFVLTICWTMVQVGQRAPHLKVEAYAILASILGILVSSYTFDAFFYHILSGVLYVNIGLCAVLWRIMRQHEADGNDGDDVRASVAVGAEA